MEEEKVIVKLHKELLESERQELKAKKRRKILIGVLCFLFLLVGAFSGFAASSIFKGYSIASFKTNKFDKIASYLETVWLYKDNYEDFHQALEDNAFYGMTTFGEDRYTTYMSKEEIESFSSNINMNYVGIGAQYSYANGISTITRVFKGSPAEEAGLLPGDIIFKINGESVEGLNSDEIKEKIVGEVGSIVKATVLRSGIEVELTFTRKAIEYTAYGEKYDNYAYLNIMSFGETTAEECIKYLDDYKDLDKLIIDLRDNSGGYQDSVQSVAGLFLGSNVIVLNETDNTGVTRSYSTIVKKYYDNFKNIVVLINENTASAAEVLSIALKEMHPNCTLVGTTTYGKGVVQSSYYLEDGSALKITTSYWTSPNGVSINNVGVSPDIEVRLDDILYQVTRAMADDETYKIDSVSPFVQIAEMGLKYLDYDVDRMDGYFDQRFFESLKEYKKDNGLTVDGVLDSNTYSAIISSVIRESSLNMSKDAQLMKAIETLGE